MSQHILTPSDALLPCPFCGSPGEYVDGERTATCANEDCEISPVMAVAAWNRRAAAIAERGEPVAWLYAYDGHNGDPVLRLYRGGETMREEPWTETPLYAAPPAAPDKEKA